MKTGTYEPQSCHLTMIPTGKNPFFPYIYDDGGYYKTEIECVKCDIRYFDAEDPVKFSEWYALYNAKKPCPHCGGSCWRAVSG